MVALGERQVIVDCDVLQADGGTRTASICGGYVALHDALTRLRPDRRASPRTRCSTTCAAISVGIIDGTPMLDLPYVEDCRAEVDMNVVMTGDGRFVEVQGTAEGLPFTRDRARRAARPRRGRHPRDHRAAGGDDRRAAAAAVAVTAAGRVPRLRRSPRPTRTRSPRSLGPRATASSWCRARPTSPTWSRTPTRSRATPGSRRSRSPTPPACRRWPTTPASRSTRSTARPACCSARYAGEAHDDADNVAKLLAALDGVPPEQRTARFSRSRWCAGPTAARSSPRASSRAASSTRSAAPTASATTRCSCPTTRTTAAPSPR